MRMLVLIVCYYYYTYIPSKSSAEQLDAAWSSHIGSLHNNNICIYSTDCISSIGWPRHTLHNCSASAVMTSGRFLRPILINWSK